MNHPDELVAADLWSDLRAYREMPEIDMARLYAYRLERLRGAMRKAGAAMCVLVSPISLRYAVDYRTYGLFQSHVPTTYLFVPAEGPLVIHGVYGLLPMVEETRPAAAQLRWRPRTDGSSALFADDVVRYLSEILDNRRVAVEYVNWSITQALLQRGLEVIDGVTVSEEARVIKSTDEIACMRWAIGVAELGIAKMRQALRPGVTELQPGACSAYTNLANNGDWHDGRMLASGPRINFLAPGGNPKAGRIRRSGRVRYRHGGAVRLFRRHFEDLPLRTGEANQAAEGALPPGPRRDRAQPRPNSPRHHPV